MLIEKEITYTVRQVANQIGLSVAVVRRHCQDGNVPDATFHEYPGTSSQGYYTMTPRSVAWLRENVEPRPDRQGPKQ